MTETVKINAAVLNETIKTLGLSSSDIAEYLTEYKEIPTEEAMVDDWRKGRANPSKKQAETVDRVLNISMEELTGTETISENDGTFDDLLQRVIREEQDDTYPASSKRQGLLLPGLSVEMNDRGVGAQDLARKLGLNTGTVRRYRNMKYGVTIEKLQQIASLLHCLPRDLTTYNHLAVYHNPGNSRSTARLQPVAGASSSKKQSQVNISGNGRADKKIADLEAQVRDLVGTVRDLDKYVNEEIQPIEEEFQVMEATLEDIEGRISSLEEEFESVQDKKSQGLLSKIFG